MNASVLPALAPRPLRWHESLWALPITTFWGCFAGVLGLAGGNAFWRLGDTFVRDYDEGRYGVAASEMLHAHSALVTTYAGQTEFWNLKPPLGYWLLELSYSLLGETPWALRFPAAVCAWVTTALVMWQTRRVAGPRAAIIAGLYLATSFGFLANHGARSGELDAPLALLMFLVLMLAPRLFDSRAARLGMGVVLGLGFLLKSFAIMPYLAAVGSYSLLTRRSVAWRGWILPVCVAGLIIITWAFARTVAEDSGEFVRRMFVEDLFLRSTTAIDPVQASIWDYPGALFDRLAPWPLMVVVAAFISPWRRLARLSLPGDFACLLWCYCLIPLLLFTLARTHHSHYIIPLYPAWAILAAVATLEVLEAAGRIQWTVPMAWLLSICLLSCEVRVFTHIEIHNRLPAAQIFLASLQNRVGPGTLLHTTFTPSYSERFFLQVVDGFSLVETPVDKETRFSGMVLMKKPDSAQWASVTVPGTVVLSQYEGYVLVRVPG